MKDQKAKADIAGRLQTTTNKPIFQFLVQNAAVKWDSTQFVNTVDIFTGIKDIPNTPRPRGNASM